ncbi:GyrI-like domain-containing protein [Engelhardtia mirabilis]|uniref:Bacterial transcription activator, effector binding domain n=1 Tax=Engelhardtia mirabilis TaxID=2528011 RepID=A0A518BFX7_9BACT|nr:Bacterial transcription activator, effector binding domain [Planctomycetes bacterium Pla133]QDV00192.1 Bacterial transcription activator, effector binding domain [Planctomycetes bacterium Pla86]
MLENPHVTSTARQPTAVIRFTIPRDEIQAVMGPAIGEVMATVKAQGLGPAGPVFSRHFRMDPEVFEFEVGVPVPRAVEPAGRVVASELPATRVARAVYRGPYEGLGQAWGEFIAWIEAQGLEHGPSLWESYVAGSESGSDPTAWRTEFNRPLVD